MINNDWPLDRDRVHHLKCRSEHQNHRVLAIGIDALEPELVVRWESFLPNLSRLRECGGFTRTRSTFPADSVPAWATIYTGKSPADHGIVDETDFLDFRSGERSRFAEVLQGNTFWDVASDHRLRVCVVNPFLAYPVWPVNGVMVGGPVFVTGEAQSFPAEIQQKHKLPELGGMVDFPSRSELPAFLERARQVTLEQVAFARTLWEMDDWDLFFVCLLTLDRVQHFLWRYSEPSDPTYPGATSLSDALRDFYILIDRLVGELTQEIENDVVVVIFSDHGHGMRPSKQVFLNEWLRRAGLLKTRSTAPVILRTDFYLERAKRSVLSTLHKLDLEDLSYWLARRLPKGQRKALKHSAYTTSREISLACLAALGAGTHTGGINLNSTRIRESGLIAEQVQRKIIRGLTELRDSRDGRRIFKWVCTREDYLAGAHLSVFPDIVFEMEEDYAVDATLYSGLIGTNPVHRRISGGHRDNGTFIVSHLDASKCVLPTSVAEIRSYILRLLGIELV